MVLKQYAGDTEEAIVCLIDSCQWNEALRLVRWSVEGSIPVH